MIIHKSVNPVAFQNTYYLENDTHLIIIDPGSDWTKFKQLSKNRKTNFGYSPDSHSL